MNNDHQQQQDKEDDNIQGNTTPKIQLQWTKKKKHISIPSYQRSTKRPLPDTTTTTTTTNGNSNDNNNNHNNSNTADSLSNGVNRYNNDTVPSQFFSFQDDDDQLGNNDNDVDDVYRVHPVLNTVDNIDSLWYVYDVRLVHNEHRVQNTIHR